MSAEPIASVVPSGEPRGDVYVMGDHEALRAVFAKWERDGQALGELLAVTPQGR